jgi:hypothetical protein
MHLLCIHTERLRYEIIYNISSRPGVDSASDRNEYQEYILVGKSGRCLGITNLQPSSDDFHEIWEPKTPGTISVSPDLYRKCFTFSFLYLICRNLILESV